VCLLGVAAVGDPARAADPTPLRSRARLIVRERAGLAREALQRALRGQGATRIDRVAQLGASIVEVPEGELAAARSALRRSGLFTSVEPDAVAVIAEDPNDPDYAAQWGLARINVPLAWEVSSGSGTVVGVVDTGVEASHPDLQGQLLPGYDFVNNDGDPADDNGHGTRMAGVIAARRNNALGIAGIAPDARVLPIKAADAQGYGLYSDIANGIVYAVDHGAQVVNLSVVGPVQSTLLLDAVTYAAAHDAVVVAASGNSGTSTPGYPAASPGVVAVGATDADDLRASFSVYGAWLGLTAPGVDIATTTLNGNYTGSTGTSPAAAFASGVFALLFAAEPTLSRSEAIARVEDNALDLGSDGWDPYYGWGRVDAYAALVPGQADPPVPDQTAPTISLLSPGKGSLLWGAAAVDVAANDNVAVARVDLHIDGEWYASATLPPYSFVVAAASFSPGPHKLRAYAYDTSGNWRRTKARRVSFTPGAGLLVEHATIRAASVSIKARFALPAGTSFDPTLDHLIMDLTSAGGTVLSAAASAGSFAVSGPRMQSTLTPAVPAEGTVRVTAIDCGDQSLYMLKIKARNLDGMTSQQPLMNLALDIGGAQLSQSLPFRAKATGTLVYP
jgi:subtilisin family serine protease